ncbi:MAG: hypothetical protein Q7T81_16930 [Pseudolabrys sp.]|nr:hypothetical protein [Pseudolabrys sp.]
MQKQRNNAQAGCHGGELPAGSMIDRKALCRSRNPPEINDLITISPARIAE